MGTWGRKLFGNDTTCDVKDSYTEYLYNQYSDEEAYKKTYEEYEELMGTDEEPLFWYALAATQWKVGRLMPSVKEKALDLIEHEGGLSLWEESKKYQEKWKLTLAELKNDLEKDMPERKIFKKEVFETNLWNIGDVYAYQFHKKWSKEVGLYGKYILLQKIAEGEGIEGIIPWIQIYAKVFDDIPTLDDIKGLKLMPFAHPDHYYNVLPDDRMSIEFNAAVERFKKRDYVKKYYTYIGNMDNPFSNPLASLNFSYPWTELESCICAWLPAWDEYDYRFVDGEAKLFKKSDPETYI